MERYAEILEDCRPHVNSNSDGDREIHGRVVEDVEKLAQLTADFKAAAARAQTPAEKRAACKAFGQASYVSTYLWDYLYKNMDQVSPFRRKAIKKYASWMDTIRMEHITTNVALGWDRIEEVLADYRAKYPESTPAKEQDKPAGGDKPKAPFLRVIK